jgi:hypothetical protein
MNRTTVIIDSQISFEFDYLYEVDQLSIIKFNDKLYVLDTKIDNIVYETFIYINRMVYLKPLIIQN